MARQKRWSESLSGLADKINAFVLIKAEKVPPATEILGFINPLENFDRKASVCQSILIVRRINADMVILTEGLFSRGFRCDRGVLIGVLQR